MGISRKTERERDSERETEKKSVCVRGNAK